jgi:PAS domain S-box-containing protein
MEIAVLLIEDNPGDAILVQEYLSEMRGVTAAVTHVTSLTAAFDALAAGTPDAILLDLSLPDASQLDGLARLHQNGTAVPATIVLTGNTQETLALDALRLGAQDYLLKEHIDPVVLERALRYAIERHQLHARLNASEQQYRALFESMAQGVIFQDAAGQIISVNPAAEAILDLPEAKLLQRTSTHTSWKIWREDGEPVPGEEHPATIALRTGQAVKDVMLNVYNPHTEDDRWLNVSSIPQFRPGEDTPFQVFTTFTDVTQRKEAEAALQENEALLRHVIDASPTCIFVKDQHGRYQLVNQAIAKLYNIEPEAMLGKTDSELAAMTRLDVTEAEQFVKDDQVVIQTRQRQFIAEERFTTHDGTVRWFQTTKTPLTIEGQSNHMLGIATDITTRKQAEEMLQLRNKQISMIYDAGKQLGRTLELETLLETAHQIIGANMDCDSLVISSFDPADQMIRCVYMLQDGVAVDVSEFPPIDLEPEGKGTQSRAIHTGESLYLPDYMTHMQTARVSYVVGEDGIQHEVEITEDQDYPRSALVVPLKLASQPIGVIQVFSYRLDAYSADNLRFIEALSPQIAAAMSNAVLYQQAQTEILERQRAEEAERAQRILAEALRDTAATMIGTITVDAVMNTILENITRVVPHDAANIMLIKGDRAEVVYWREYRPDFTLAINGLSIQLNEAPKLREMIIKGTGCLIPDVKKNTGWKQMPDTDWVRSYVGAPIRVQGNVIGFLNVDSATPNFFDEGHARSLQTFADQASIAIERAQLYDEIRSYTTKLEQRVADRTVELITAKERTEAILESSNDILIICRPDGTIEQVNPAFEATFGQPAESALNHPMSGLLTEDYQFLLKKAFQHVVNTHEPERLEVRACSNQRITFDADMVLSPVMEADNQLVSVVCSMRDITQRKQVEKQLQQALEREIEVSDMRMRFISMASHDLRNPLAVIQAGVHILENYSDRLTEQKKADKFSHIRASITHMIELLDDVLTIGRVEAGKLEFKPTQVELDPFFENIISDMRITIGTNHLIRFSGCGARVIRELDPKMLRHILHNLLSNAIKYSPTHSTITVDLKVRDGQTIFSIQDAGIGIPEEDQRRLFEPFHRAGNVGEVSGTGLGLSIVQRSVELHGGTITCESAEGAGTTFIVCLPDAGPGGDRA